MNRVNRRWWNGVAESAQEACASAGWPIGECWVRQRTPIVPDRTRDSGQRGGGWKNV